MPESIDESSLERLVEGFAFFYGEAGVAHIFLGARQIDVLVRDIQIPAKNDGLGFLQFEQMLIERGSPFPRAVIQSGQFAFGIWRVNIHEVEILELRRDDATFLVVFWTADSIGDGEGFFTG